MIKDITVKKKNYIKGILDYKIVPFIFPKDNFNHYKLETELKYPSEIFNQKTNTRKDIVKFQSLKKLLFEKLNNWKKYNPIRGKLKIFLNYVKKVLI